MLEPINRVVYATFKIPLVSMVQIIRLVRIIEMMRLHSNTYGGLSTDVGDLMMSYIKSDSDYSFQTGYRGALVWLGGQYAFTSFVDNAFALGESR